ncbi:MAG TPA: SPASM domain-containing protein, partial [Candidatus Ozemobacteraceae bacterium]|nr:SPASM domain-containing protein [Candidatus Ozemobacteraceae bacterium]
NLSYLVEAKRKRRSPLPELWFHFIINRYNEGEMEEYVNLVDRLTSPVKHLFPPIIFWTNLLAFDEVADLVVAIPEQRREGILQKCQERGIYAIWNENVSHDKSMTQCTKWTEPFILVSGHLQPCCALNEANQRRYQEEHAFINVFEEDFHQFWDGDRLKNFVRTLQSGGINEVCRYCHIFNHPGIWRGLRRKM